MTLYQPQLLYLDAGQQIDKLEQIKNKLIAAPATEETLALVKDAIEELVAELSGNSVPSNIATTTHQETQNTRLQEISTKLGDLKTYTDNLETLTTDLKGFVDQLEGYLDTVEPKLDTLIGKFPTALSSSDRLKADAIAKTIVKKFRDDFSGTTLDSSKWITVQTGAGHTVSVASSELNIATGVTANSETIIRSIDTCKFPFRLQIQAKLSQRIINQEFTLQIIDSSGKDYAQILFDSNSGTTSKVSTANDDNNTGTTNLFTITTANYQIFEFECNVDNIIFNTRPSDSNIIRTLAPVIKTRQIPNVNLDYYIQIKAKNLTTAPASSTILSIDSIGIQNYEEFVAEIGGGKAGNAANQALGVTPTGGSLTVNSTTTAPVYITDVAATYNEFTLPFTANQSSTGTARDTAGVKNRGRWLISTDQLGTLIVLQSTDNTAYFQTHSFAITGNVNQASIGEFNLILRYYKIQYVNGATAQTTMRLIHSVFNIGA